MLEYRENAGRATLRRTGLEQEPHALRVQIEPLYFGCKLLGSSLVDVLRNADTIDQHPKAAGMQYERLVRYVGFGELAGMKGEQVEVVTRWWGKDQKNASSLKRTFLIDPLRGHTVVRMICVYTEYGKEIGESESLSTVPVEVADGVWIPEKTEYKQYPSGLTGPTQILILAQVKHAKIAVPEDVELRMKLPEGTKVFDEVDNVTYDLFYEDETEVLKRFRKMLDKEGLLESPATQPVEK